MNSIEKDVDNILNYVEDAKMTGRNECVYSTDKLSGSIYKVLLLLKEKLPEYSIWYVDPFVPQSPFNLAEESGIHIHWL